MQRATDRWARGPNEAGSGSAGPGVKCIMYSDMYHSSVAAHTVKSTFRL